MSLALDKDVAVKMPIPQHEPGIYFSMPDAEYHADISFSASGIVNAQVSAQKFWVSSNFNPNRKDKDSDAKKLGRAYHAMILEGEAAFRSRYGVLPAKEDHPDAIDGLAALKAYVEEAGIPVSKPQPKSIADWCSLIRTHDAAVELWDEIKTARKAALGEREGVKAADFAAIEAARYVIDHLDDTKQLLTKGRSEVSIFWVNVAGVPMKARIDFLRFGEIIDLKTFANEMEKPVEVAACAAIASRKYFVQPVVYLEGIRAIQKLWLRQREKIVHGEVDLRWLEWVLGAKQFKFTHLWVQKGDCPDVLPRDFDQFDTMGGQTATPNEYWRRGAGAYAHAVDLFVRCIAQYGTDTRWLTDFGRRAYRDTDFPAHMFTGPEASI